MSTHNIYFHGKIRIILFGTPLKLRKNLFGTPLKIRKILFGTPLKIRKILFGTPLIWSYKYPFNMPKGNKVSLL